MSKQDRQGARTVPQLEQKYSFGKSFAEVYEIATGARKTAEEAKETAEEAKENPNIDHEAVFNALTEDGKCQGLYRDKDGNIYINAEFIQSGVFRGETDIFLEPGMAELDRIRYVYNAYDQASEEELALFDFNGNGLVDETDVSLMEQAVSGEISLADVWDGAEASKVTIKIDVWNPKKAISFTATNMWGRVLDYSIGIENEIFIDEGRGHLYVIDGNERVWLNPPLTYDGGVRGEYFRTIEQIDTEPIFKRYNPDTLMVEYRIGYGANWYPLYHKDGIIERGTSGIWTYEKWHSGKLEMWGMAQHIAASSDFVSFKADYPVPFIATPVVTVSAGANGGWVKDRYPYLNTLSTAGVAITYRNATSDAITSDLHIHAIGRWK